ncbi:MAG: MerR family transcriptional regulator [Candidatus Dormibacteria bacterium]
MAYRIDQLASRCGVSVDTVRYYQSRRLLPPPRREGRIAWYDDDHAARIARIRELHSRGLTLAAVRRVLDGDLDTADTGLAMAVASAQAPAAEPVMTLDEFASHCGLPPVLVRGFVDAGVDLGRTVDGETRFTDADVAMVRLGLRVLEQGLPLTDLVSLAQQHSAATRRTAEAAVALFDEHVRRPIRAAGGSTDEVAANLVGAFEALLPAVTELVAHHFRHVLLAAAEDHISSVGDEAELAATRSASRPRLQVVWTE